jgi:hypothetical protein
MGTSIGTKEKFGAIYSSDFWRSGESVSGSGSEMANTARLVRKLEHLITERVIESIVDCPCGDFNWQHPLLEHPAICYYVGADIVPELIAANKAKQWQELTPSFIEADIITSKLPKAELLIVRDCLVHLPKAQVVEALKNIAQQDCQLVAITSFMGADRVNYDIEMGEWRPINLLEYPYSLPYPVDILVEECTEGDGAFTDKSLAVWEMWQLRAWAAARGSM